MSDSNGNGVSIKRLRLGMDDLRWLFVLIVAGISWGLKIEFTLASSINRIDEVNRIAHAQLLARIEVIEQQLAAGVLPRADERITTLERSHIEIDQRLHDLEVGR